MEVFKADSVLASGDEENEEGDDDAAQLYEIKNKEDLLQIYAKLIESKKY
jgi:hypothetical protein